MSRLTTYFLLLFSMSILASCVTVPKTPEVPEGERSLQKIHEIDLKKNEVFDKSLEWMAQTFVDSNEHQQDKFWKYD